MGSCVTNLNRLAGTTILFLLVGALLLAAQPAHGKMLCVNASRAHLRKGPGRNFTPPTWTIHRFMPLKELEREGEWVKVMDLDGDTHWILGKLVTDKIKCISVKAPSANIHSKPKIESRTWFRVEKYTSFKMLGTIPKWVKLDYHGEVMWVYHTLIWPN